MPIRFHDRRALVGTQVGEGGPEHLLVRPGSFHGKIQPPGDGIEAMAVQQIARVEVMTLAEDRLEFVAEEIGMAWLIDLRVTIPQVGELLGERGFDLGKGVQ